MADYYKHKYGGIYQFLYLAYNKSDNCKEMIVFKHVYPFDNPKIYVRDKNDFYTNYKLLSNSELKIELSKEKEIFQNEIVENVKNKNREKEKEQ